MPPSCWHRSQLQAASIDPWESVNRPIFTFNDTVDTYALKPLAQGYQFVTPQFVQDGVHNFFHNIGDVGNLANNVLQLKPHNAGVDTARLLVNTRLAYSALSTSAPKWGCNAAMKALAKKPSATGVWAAARTLMIPLLGPSTLRDAPSKYVDSYTQPYRYMNDIGWRNSTFGLNVVDVRASLLGSEKLISGDKYTFIRNAYLQNREFKVKDGKVVDDF